MKNTDVTYESPAADVIAFEPEGVLCQSQGSGTYSHDDPEDGGSSLDFRLF